MPAPLVPRKNRIMRLDVIDLGCERAERAVFAGVSFSLDAGDGLLVRGANGAGKSSLLRIMAGLAEPSTGRITMTDQGQSLPRANACHYVAHADAVKATLTVEEHLYFFSHFLAGQKLGSRDLNDALARLDLLPLRRMEARYLSAGQRRRLSLARLLIVKRPLWLLDEPTSALDQTSLAAVDAILAHHRQTGGIVMASTHDALALPNAKTLVLGAPQSRGGA